MGKMETREIQWLELGGISGDKWVIDNKFQLKTYSKVNKECRQKNIFGKDKCPFLLKEEKKGIINDDLIKSNIFLTYFWDLL